MQLTHCSLEHPLRSSAVWQAHWCEKGGEQNVVMADGQLKDSGARNKTRGGHWVSQLCACHRCSGHSDVCHHDQPVASPNYYS